MTEKISRRTFTKAGVVSLGLTAANAKRVLGANDRIRLGFIGVANRGSQLLTAILQHDDAEVVALCDISQPILAKAADMVDYKVDRLADFRKLIDRTDIDAVVIATPDHWHAIQTIDACNAGKDVYVEKPFP